MAHGQAPAFKNEEASIERPLLAQSIHLLIGMGPNADREAKLFIY